MAKHENFIRIHLINRIIQMSVKKTKDQRLSIVIGLNDIIELDRYPKFKIFGLSIAHAHWSPLGEATVLAYPKELED